MVLRSASITSWLEKGNHGDTTISTPSSMPNQSSHVRCLLKKPKPDIVNLPLKKEAYVGGRDHSITDIERDPAASAAYVIQKT